MEAVLLGGANGAGKTTLARQLLPLEHPDAAFLNADEILHRSGGRLHPVAAGRRLLELLDEHVTNGRSFTIETTMASDAHARRVPQWRASGYRVILYFIEVSSADLAVARVAHRVAMGGHDVPEVDVRRRFARGLTLFEKTYKPLVDEWYHWFSDEQGLRLIDSGPA